MIAFANGFGHFFAPVQLLAVAALGLLAGQQNQRFPASIIAAYAFGIAGACILTAAALRERNATEVLLALTAFSGTAVSAARALAPTVKLIMGSATGGTLAFISPPQEISIPAAIAAQAGTALAALVTFALVIAISMQADRPWQRIAVRIVGSWIAASAILVLALRLIR